MSYIEDLFSVRGKVVLFTGGAGVLSSAIARGLGRAGAIVILTDIAPLDDAVRELRKDGVEAFGLFMDALHRENVEEVAKEVGKRFGRVDALLNAAGGNVKEATASPEVPFFDLPVEAVEKVVRLNLLGGAIIPSQVFGKMMVRNEEGGSIINFSSMAAFRPLTRVVGYSAAKAAVSNFTQWLAVYIARECTPKVRVNALAPGFFLTKQNRYLLLNEDGSLTPRGESVIAHTPQGRFGQPEDLIGTVIWLISPASQFVTGAVIPVDGGFNAFCGV
jgi:NAD(P)-dependent dehydrogenase (short-subunit alcohol dehydrogenase family)